MPRLNGRPASIWSDVAGVRGCRRQLGRRLVDVDPDPTDDRPLGRLEQDPGHLAGLDEHVVRPSHESGYCGLPLDCGRHGEPGHDRELLLRGVRRWPQQHRAEKRGRGCVVPVPAGAATAGRLMLRHGDSAVRQGTGAEEILGRRCLLDVEVRISQLAAKQRAQPLRLEVTHFLSPASGASSHRAASWRRDAAPSPRATAASAPACAPPAAPLRAGRRAGRWPARGCEPDSARPGRWPAASGRPGRQRGASDARSARLTIRHRRPPRRVFPPCLHAGRRAHSSATRAAGSRRAAGAPNA